jgi:hypothetical protein
MTDNERIEKILASIDLIIKSLNSNNAGAYFEYKGVLALLCFDNNELHKVFIENIPADQLGQLNSWLINFINQPVLDHGDSQKIIQSLNNVKQTIHDNIKHKNCRVFYSWQSDIPNNINRGLIQTSIQEAAEELNNENNWNLYIDSDTRGTCGSPDIVTTILHKIDNSSVFIADVSSITKLDNKLIPNPNVMFELGYAIKSISSSKIIMIFNEFTGNINDIPFDLGLKRQIVYNYNEEEVGNKKEIIKELKNRIKKAIKVIVET